MENLGKHQSSNSIPETIDLNADDADVITIGRLAEDPTLQTQENNKDVNEDSRRNSRVRVYKYVQLDSSAHEPIISRKHAQIKYRRIHRLIGTEGVTDEADDLSEADQNQEYEHAWVIRDLGSTNGILVNGVRVREYRLRDSDIVSFGGAATVELGSSVQTHKRKPVDSIFLYRFVCE
uniref:FHA domain-containing protein n=3 Tax=Aplanochytrium stocchinoi TaxID=215587 RepID=A0A7S3UZH9_9STRA